MRNLTRYQTLALLPLLVLLTGGYYFQDLVLYAVETNRTLNGIILGVMLAGVGIMHQQIWSIRQQSRLSRTFLHRIEQGESLSDVLHDPVLGTSDIGRVCGHLTQVNGAIGGRPVAAVEAGLRSLHVSLESRQELSQFLVGFLIALGLVGTFIGILETLVQIGHMIGGFADADMKDIDKAFMGLVADLTKPLKGMGTAFSASLFGLIGSLCLGLTMVALRRCTEQFVTGMRHTVNQLIKDLGVEEDVLPGMPNESFFSKFLVDVIKQQRESLNLFHQGLEANVRVMQKIDTLEQRLGDVSDAMRKQVEASVETNSLLRDNPVTRQIAERFMGEIKVLATAATENSANVASLLPALSGVTQKLSGFSETLLQQREQMQQTMFSATESQGMIRSALTTLVEKEGDIRAGVLGEITQLRKFMLDMQPVSASMLPLLNEINRRLNEQLIALDNQQETVRFMTQTITQSFVGIKTGIAEMLLDAEKSRQLQVEMTQELLNTQRTASEFSNIQNSLAQIADALANQLAVSQVLVEEVRNVRGAVVRDMRLEMHEMLHRQEMGRKAAADNASSDEE